MGQIINLVQGQTITLHRQVSFTDYLDSFKKYLDVQKSSTYTYITSLKQFISYLSEVEAYEPTRETILGYKAYLEAKGLKPTTMQNYLIAVKLFFAWLEQEGIYKNIAQHIKAVKVSKEPKKEHLTTSQIKLVLNSIDTSTLQGLRNYAMIYTMFSCGLRTIEVSRLNIEDLRTYGNSSVLAIQGKGKNDKADFVAVSEQGEKVLRQYLATCRTGAKGTEPLFVSTSNNNTDGRLSTKTISTVVKTAFRGVGLDSDKLTAHSLRHTAVTLSLMAGATLQETQQFARHSNINTTLIYAHNIEKANNSCSTKLSSLVI